MAEALFALTRRRGEITKAQGQGAALGGLTHFNLISRCSAVCAEVLGLLRRRGGNVVAVPTEPKWRERRDQVSHPGGIILQLAS